MVCLTELPIICLDYPPGGLISTDTCDNTEFAVFMVNTSYEDITAWVHMEHPTPSPSRRTALPDAKTMIAMELATRAGHS